MAKQEPLYEFEMMEGYDYPYQRKGYVYPCALCGMGIIVHKPTGDRLHFCKEGHKYEYYTLRDNRGRSIRVRLLQRALYRESIPPSISRDLLERTGMIERLEEDKFQLTDSGLSLYYEIGIETE